MQLADEPRVGSRASRLPLKSTLTLNRNRTKNPTPKLAKELVSHRFTGGAADSSSAPRVAAPPSVGFARALTRLGVLLFPPRHPRLESVTEKD